MKSVLFILLFITSYTYCKVGDRCEYKNGYHGKCSIACDNAQLKAIAKLGTVMKLCNEDLFCCISEEFITQPIAIPSFEIANRISHNMCVEYSNKTKNLVNGLDDKISYGVNAEPGDYPHMATLGSETEDGILWLCGGSLISDKYILTAAHCLTFREKITHVQLGQVKLSDVKEENIFKLDKIFIHPDFIRRKAYNDIALIKLQKTVDFTPLIKPACLTTLQTNYELQATGWGDTHKRQNMTDILQTVTLDRLDNLKCSEIPFVQEKLPGGLRESQMCAVSSEYKDTCQGDSGGPIQELIFTKKLHNIVGITSRGVRPYCGRPDIPGIYTRVSSYLPWIEDIVWPKPKRISVEMCEKYSEQLIDVVLEDFGDKIIGGRDVTEGEYPHMAALGYGTMRDVKWLCGGSLISNKFILTAAHCRSSPNSGEVQFVQLGFVNINDRPKSTNFFLINKIHVHEKYRPPLIYNDIAVIELARPVIFSANIKPACLYSEYFKELDENSITATGWGLTSYSGIKSNILQTVELKLFDSCKQFYKKVSRRKLDDGVIDSQMCVGGDDDKDTCQGDSGGPLQVLHFKNKLHVIKGVTSAGLGCGSGRPALYTRVSSYLDWIEDIVWSSNKSFHNTLDLRFFL